jgi:predicted nucleotidyltransferase
MVHHRRRAREVVPSGQPDRAIKEIKMLELSAVDLGALAEALEDHSDMVQWFIDPATGEVVPWMEDGDEPSPDEAGGRYIDPIPSGEAYGDMRDFVARVPDRRVADLLSRAIEGRGAFRRFKDSLFEFPELRETWFRFHDVRMRRRAIEWLVDCRLVDDSVAEAALGELEDPAVGKGTVDPYELAHDVAGRLRDLFGSRLLDVVLFGSYATGTATDESDLDLAVILSDAASPWEDAHRMDQILWQKTLESGITVSTVVIDAADWQRATAPLLASAKAQGRSVS